MEVCGNKDIPAILSRSPVYLERKDSDTIEKKAQTFPCDDEDECGDVGSGELKEEKDSDSGSLQFILLENIDLYLQLTAIGQTMLNNLVEMPALYSASRCIGRTNVARRQADTNRTDFHTWRLSRYM